MFSSVSWSLFMQALRSNRKHVNAIYSCLMIVMCCTVVLLSSSTSSLTNALNPPTSTPTSVVKPTVTSVPVLPKTDSNSIATEGVPRAELAKIQKIMASMTLDQKLGQLIVVEYIGNSYQNGLQYMISQQ